VANNLQVIDRISDAVGATPLLRLHRVVEGLDCEAFAKLELLNPMGSIKDRIAKYFIEKALDDGSLDPDGVILEASSGNTAMGLAMMALLEERRCRMVVRRETSAEKLDGLRAMGVELDLVDGTLPAEDPASYNRRAGELAGSIPGVFFPDQHNNRANNEVHYLTTGPEIWQQMQGRVDILVAGIGTGGTISGIARYLKQQDPNVRIVAVDVEGSVFTEYFRTGQHGPAGSYRLEGLGDEEIIGCPEFELIDEMIQVSDRQAFLAARELARKEAVLAGGSSGAALWGLRKVAETSPSGSRIVTIFPDSGFRYLSTLYSDDWMRERGYLD
jgi:cystathionine beta-synthase